MQLKYDELKGPETRRAKFGIRRNVMLPSLSSANGHSRLLIEAGRRVIKCVGGRKLALEAIATGARASIKGNADKDAASAPSHSVNAVTAHT